MEPAIYSEPPNTAIELPALRAAAHSQRYAARDIAGVAALGCAMAYGPGRPDIFRRAAAYVDKILKGAEPSDFADRAADKIRARNQSQDREAIGLTIPQNVLFRADIAIE